ncbi:hypothetical protein W97_02205 [Coniosporium apollinis CBS 100218]|uniref:DUF4048 domain-containing protein n=1 Tax=Coniosporium apollinis (strain CBS 100218) TaxID=1168221 RepID=R7YMD8_CONA1|nr:uncharacterized protein W97_02205 [Coniosporium apollinis CBS 100218]EON62979.1 hypothetical protein W97_02205 [Coniosporium apollinis CBS 100218]
MPPPAEHIGSPTSPRRSEDFPRPQTGQMPPHGRSMSLADVARQAKRLSLNFPIQPAPGSPTRRSRPVSWVESPIPTPDTAQSPTREGNFLTALAAQERRVLELKDELKQAEQELEKLKKQWANHEVLRKRNDVRRVQQLQPLNTSFASLATFHEDVDGSDAWLQKEMDRRKALLSGAKTSQRKVFSGSRHTRALSLLSPDKESFGAPTSQPGEARRPEDRFKRPSLLPRASTTSDLSTHIADAPAADPLDMGAMQRDALLRTGKQMASEFKDGLWMFIEDLRQATIGDEAVQGTQPRAGQTPHGGQRQVPRRQSDKTGLKGAAPAPPPVRRTTSSNAAATARNPSPTKASADTSALIDIGGSFWKEHGLDEPRSSKAVRVSKPPKSPQKPSRMPLRQPPPSQRTPQKAGEDEDSWDVWDTPTDKPTTASNNSSSNESSDGRASPSSGHSSSGSTDVTTPGPVSASAGQHPAVAAANRDSIPWPALVKLSPSNLKRTASHLMSQWENSLTPPPAEGRGEGRDYLTGSPSVGKGGK